MGSSVRSSSLFGVVSCLLLWAIVAPARAAVEVIKVGAVVPLTGRYAGGGAQVRAGYELAVEAINKAGGVPVKSLGRSLALHLTLLDDESDPTKTVSRLETLLATHGVVAYLGGFGSDLHAAAAAIAEKNKVPYLGVAFALQKVHQQGYRYLFSPFWKSPDGAREIFVLLNASIAEGQRPRRIAIFQEKTDWGKELADLWGARAPEFGYQVATVGEYAIGAKDFSAIILKAKAAGAEAVFAVPNPPDGMNLVKQMKELDFAPKLLFLIRAPDPVVWGRNLGKDGDYVVLLPGWHHAARFPGVRELNEAHQQRLQRPADPITGPAYAAVQILADALARAGDLDREKVRDALAAADVSTVAGRIKFRPYGTGVVPILLVQWQQGKHELIWPRDMASAPFQYPAPHWSRR